MVLLVFDRLLFVLLLIAWNFVVCLLLVVGIVVLCSWMLVWWWYLLCLGFWLLGRGCLLQGVGRFASFGLGLFRLLFGWYFDAAGDLRWV